MTETYLCSTVLLKFGTTGRGKAGFDRVDESVPADEEGGRPSVQIDYLGNLPIDFLWLSGDPVEMIHTPAMSGALPLAGAAGWCGLSSTGYAKVPSCLV
jgi:hypothetical protein